MSVERLVASERQPANLASQARHMSEHYPELYDHLKRRDRALERALARIPSRADIELASTFNARTHLEQTLRDLAPGVGALVDGEVDHGA